MIPLRIHVIVAVGAFVGLTAPASAELVVSQLIVELSPTARTADVVVFNDSPERAFVSIEPREILSPGTPAEQRVAKPDPRELGLLLSSTRLILEPQQKKLLRLAAISLPAETERVYRVIVKPVVGDLDATASGLKVLVGYEMLVMVRPAKASPIRIEPRRANGELTLTNRGNSSIELIDGRRCLVGKAECSPLPAKRLYAGASWTQPVPSGGRVEYRALSIGKSQLLDF